MSLFVVMLLIASVSADEKNKQQAYSNADHTITAAEQEQNNPDCHIGSGIKYSDGKGGVRDYAEELKWAQDAEQQDDAIAQFFLGSAYSNGCGVPRDHKEAAKLYRKAANQGFNLGARPRISDFC